MEYKKKTVFIVSGYGVPKDIFKDFNHNIYLLAVFNKIFDTVRKDSIKKPLIICSGGKTDTFKPYRRSEGGEIVKLLKSFTKRPYLKAPTKDWEFAVESKSLSTLDNSLYSLEILKRKRISKAKIYIFCEATRTKKVKLLSKKVFGSSYVIRVVPVDFDVSANRYLDQEFIDKKESIDIKYSLWALENPENYKQFRKIFQDKITYWRKQGKNNSPQQVKKWWEKKLAELDIK